MRGLICWTGAILTSAGLSGSAAFSAQSFGPEPPGTVTSLSKLATMAPEDGAKGQSVRLRGTVTLFERERGMLFVQDGPYASIVRIPVTRENEEADPQIGQLIEIDGVTTGGRVKCGIRSKALRVVGPGQLPEALELNAARLFTDQAESRLVRVQGWIPSVSFTSGRLSFRMFVRPGQSVEVALNAGDSPEVNALPGSFAEATGVFSARFDEAGHISGGRLDVGSPAYVRTLKSLPIVPVADVGISSTKSQPIEPFRIRGTVANHSLGEFLILRDSTASIRVPYRGLNYFNPGSLVEVFAYPLQLRPTLILTNVIVKLVPPDTTNQEPAPAIITPKVANPNLPTLSRISQVRKLSPQEASRGYPVLITGVVTYYDVPSYLHFVQDDTSGIYFDQSRVENMPSIRSGRRVSIQGFSAPGDYAPVIISQTIQVLDDEAYPSPESVTFAKLMAGNFDSQWVMLRGVVRNQWFTTNSASLALFAADGLIKVVLPPLLDQAGMTNLVDAAVEVRGVCRTLFNDRRRLQGVELQVPDWSQLAVKEPAGGDPFELPVRAINDFFQFHAEDNALHRARLMGVVTLKRADGSVYLQDGSGAIQIQPSGSAPALSVGTLVDAVGFPTILDKRVMLQEAIVRPLRSESPIEPAELKTEAALEESLQATLVRLQGQVLGCFSHGSEEVLTLRFGQKTVDLVLEKQSAQDDLSDCAPGAVVRATGVYANPASDSPNAQSFRLLLRSPSDLTVLSRPSWWTLQRAVWAVGGLVAVLLLALGWVRALRRQVIQRTAELHEEIEHHKRTETKLEAEIAERKRMETEVERSHQELLIASRQAGMAEVATSVLHNVGNVLNSVNVSASLVGEKIRTSKVGNIARAAEMIKAHSHELAHYLEHDPKGRQLPQYLGRLAQHLDGEQTAILGELDSLRKNVEHIKGIVGMQQKYAKVFGAAEPVKPTELVEDALRLNSGALVRHEVRVIREYEANLPDITVDKHKLLQILVNLICNAKKACDESIHAEKLLTVRVANAEGRLRISVIDNGVGIPKENLMRIFNHGFTTRKDGHGFGLHSGALAAKEMGGALVAQSEGPGKGASFTVELPLPHPSPDI